MAASPANAGMAASAATPQDQVSTDLAFMARALELAARGIYTTTPNPRVGAVVARGGEILGEGFHRRPGEAHAEVAALDDARARGHDPRGATVYVNLEPCNHQGRTGACTRALIDAGVARVVFAMRDPHAVAAGGAATLAAAGIAVTEGIAEDAAQELNVGFIARVVRGMPWVRVKLAASLDGRTALASGESQWITGAAARADGHAWRARACAILTGVGTVAKDDPQLTVLKAVSLVCIALLPIPYYILAFVLLILFGYLWPVLPISGGYTMNMEQDWSWEFILSLLRHGILPVASLALVGLGGWFMGMRSLVSNIVTEDYVTYAELGGVKRGRILGSYVMRNALVPQVTGLAISLGSIFNGAIITEQVFGYPGIGTLLISAVHAGDYSLVLGITTVSILAVSFAVLLIDLAYPLLDPRVKAR